MVYAREENDPPGTGYMVATYKQLDGRIIKDIERIKWMNQQPDYSFADELEKKNAEAEAAREYEYSQKIGENAEKLAWALRKDLGLTDHTAFIKDGKSE